MSSLPGRRHIGQHAQPAEWIDALEHLHRRRRNAAPADAMEPIAAGDEVAGDLVRHALVRYVTRGDGSREVVQRDVFGFVDARRLRTRRARP